MGTQTTGCLFDQKPKNEEQSTDLDVTDPTFVEDLRASNEHVWFVARWLQELGNHVTVRAQRIRPTAAQRLDFGDQGDLEIIQRVEVKHRPRYNFTCREDFPHPTVIVDVCHTYDNAKPKPFFYVILNAPRTHAFVVMNSTHDKWVKEERFDGRLGRKRWFYECPVEYARVHRLSTSAA